MQVESISVREDLPVSGVTLMIISPFHTGTHQLNHLSNFLSTWMFRVLQLALTGAARSNFPPPSGSFLLQSPAP